MRHFAARWLPGLLLLLFGIALWFNGHPIRLPAEGPRVPAEFPARDDGRATLLIVDQQALRAAQPGRLSERWPDLEWDNLLTQAIGGCDIVDTKDAAGALEDRSLVVIPLRTARHLDPGLLGRLRQRVRDYGLSVLIESPDSTLCQEFGMELSTVERLRLLPWPTPSVQTGNRGPRLRPRPLPFEWTRYRYAPMNRPGHPRPTVQASLDGRPLGWVQDEGKGQWIVLAMDFADLATRLRQGAPDEDLRLRDRYKDVSPGPVESNDLILSRGLLQADNAWLDAWIEGVLGSWLTRWPVPRLSTAPFEADGWLLMSHDDEGYGDRTRWLTEAEAGKGLPSTAFFLAHPTGLTRDGADSIFVGPVAAGLHTRWPSERVFRDPDHNPSRRYGVWKFQPFGRPPSLLEQRQDLESVLPPGTRLVANRNHYLLWDENPDRPFEELLGAEFKIDSTFGPDWGAAGWLYGSSVPFRPLAMSGLSFDLHEVPYQAAETNGGVDSARLDRWMRTNAEGGAGPIQLLFHPNAYAWMPSAELFRYWQSVAVLARQHRHHAANVVQLVDWWQRRSDIRLRAHAEGDTLVIQVGKVPTGEDGFALMVPVRWRSLRLSGWSLDQGVARSRKVQRFDRSYRLIEIREQTSGREIRLRYR